MVGGVQHGGKRGRGSSKSVVVIAVEIKQPKGFGRMRMRHIPDASGASLIPFVCDVVAPGSVVLTDGWNGYNRLPDHGYIWKPTVLSSSGDPAHVSLDEYNEGQDKDRQIDATQSHEVFENPAYSVNISVDDVGVTEQKADGRSRDSVAKESKHYVQNTVIHIQQGVKKYIIDGLGIRQTMILLTSFLLYNGLLTNKNIIFFADGAPEIKNAIKDIYGWRPYQIILDWYHLKKKCKERLSMALKGSKIRNDVLKEVLALLWLGKVDSAALYLLNLDNSKVRNAEEIKKLIVFSC